MTNPLWEYSLATYDREGVACACLALQDEYDLDVNLLLYAAWLASMNLCLPPAHLAQLQEQVASWRDSVVKPLRVLRRQLRNNPPARDIYQRLQALELDAERQQQATMYRVYQLADDLPCQQQPLLPNLISVAAANNGGAASWRPAIERLVGLLMP